MSDWLSGAPVVLALLAVAVLLVAESGLVVGVALPAATPVIGLGLLVGAGAAPVWLVVGVCSAATLVGVALGHRVARTRQGVLTASGRRRIPRRALARVDHVIDRWSGAVAAHPVAVGGGAQMVAGARTLAPRLAAQAGVPLPRLLAGAAPAAAIWVTGLVSAGAWASTALPLVRGAAGLLGVPLLLVAAAMTLRGGHGRRRDPAGRPGCRRRCPAWIAPWTNLREDLAEQVRPAGPPDLGSDSGSRSSVRERGRQVVPPDCPARQVLSFTAGRG